jgi:hypothetical protein
VRDEKFLLRPPRQANGRFSAAFADENIRTANGRFNAM